MHIHFSSLGSFLQDKCDEWFQARGEKVALLGSLANDRKEIDTVLRGEVPCTRRLIWDSGAYSVSSGKVVMTLERYVELVKNIIETDVEYDIVGLDVIGDAKGSQRNYMTLKYDYGFGNDFMPVYHYGEDLHYLEFLVKEGFTYIGLGGMGGINRVSQDSIRNWVRTSLFEHGDGRTLRYPHVKWHGFAMTSKETVHQFPFYSVDSAAWVKNSALGKLLTPFGEWRASEDPRAGADASHILRAGKQTLDKIEEWLASLGLTVDGVIKNRFDKHIANLNYFLWIEKTHNWQPSRVSNNTMLSLLEQMGETGHKEVSNENKLSLTGFKINIPLTIKPVEEVKELTDQQQQEVDMEVAQNQADKEKFQPKFHIGLSIKPHVIGESGNNDTNDTEKVKVSDGKQPVKAPKHILKSTVTPQAPTPAPQPNNVVKEVNTAIHETFFEKDKSTHQAMVGTITCPCCNEIILVDVDITARHPNTNF